MAEAIDIRELNIRIEQQSQFVTNLVMGMNKVIVGQKHLVAVSYTHLDVYKRQGCTALVHALRGVVEDCIRSAEHLV